MGRKTTEKAEGPVNTDCQCKPIPLPLGSNLVLCHVDVILCLCFQSDLKDKEMLKNKSCLRLIHLVFNLLNFRRHYLTKLVYFY